MSPAERLSATCNLANLKSVPLGILVPSTACHASAPGVGRQRLHDVAGSVYERRATSNNGEPPGGTRSPPIMYQSVASEPDIFFCSAAPVCAQRAARSSAAAPLSSTHCPSEPGSSGTGASSAITASPASITSIVVSSTSTRSATSESLPPPPPPPLPPAVRLRYTRYASASGTLSHVSTTRMRPRMFSDNAGSVMTTGADGSDSPPGFRLSLAAKTADTRYW
mmetsp:Transcript_14785/g.36603  ORF Transcript_14785/g.36603 Transcript_14785/m.36603 type:complete len:223 (-) Transcript_14785:569-1237(-)